MIGGESFYELGWLAVGPGIVLEAETETVANRGMVVEQQDVQRIRIGVRQSDFTEHLEGLRGDLSGVSRQSVRHLEAVPDPPGVRSSG